MRYPLTDHSMDFLSYGHYMDEDFNYLALDYFEDREDENFTRWRLFTCFLLDTDEIGE